MYTYVYMYIYPYICKYIQTIAHMESIVKTQAPKQTMAIYIYLSIYIYICIYRCIYIYPCIYLEFFAHMESIVKTQAPKQTMAMVRMPAERSARRRSHLTRRFQVNSNEPRVNPRHWNAGVNRVLHSKLFAGRTRRTVKGATRPMMVPQTMEMAIRRMWSHSRLVMKPSLA